LRHKTNPKEFIFQTNVVVLSNSFSAHNFKTRLLGPTRTNSVHNLSFSPLYLIREKSRGLPSCFRHVGRLHISEELKDAQPYNMEKHFNSNQRPFLSNDFYQITPHVQLD